MNALIYGPSGAGKTVNASLVSAPSRGKNLLVCTDNSSVVLRNFERPNLTIANVSNVDGFVNAYQKGYQSKEYDNIILDNVSDLIDMWLLELDDSGKFKDFRQAYQLVYQSLKRLSRESTALDCNTIFTAWQDVAELTQPNGERITRIQPKIPAKILDNFCGLMNVVALVSSAVKDGERRWYYVMEGSTALLAKDQVACRKSCMPEDIFLGGVSE